MDDFEERHGWAPDSDYEIVECNISGKEAVMAGLMGLFMRCPEVTMIDEDTGEITVIDKDTGEELKLSLCTNCWCMTYTKDGKCAKCKAQKEESKNE